MTYRVGRREAVIVALLMTACSSQPLTMTSERAGATSVVLGDHVYVIGGSQQRTTLSSIERAAIHADGSIGTFEAVIDTRLETGRSGASNAVLGNELYVFGGDDGSAALPTVERASIAADGSLGMFETVTTAPLLTLHVLGSSTVGGNGLYFTGGQDSASHAVTGVERTNVNSDGSLGDFATDAELVTARYLHSSVVIGTTVYVIGGNNGASMLSSVERASINADGSLGAFATTETPLLTARMSHESIVIGDQLYVLGGVDGPLAYVTQAEHATIAADGSLGPFDAISGGKFVSPRTEISLAVIGDYLYGFGGFEQTGITNSVVRARLSGDGVLGDFESVTE